MVDDFTLGLPLFTGVVIIISLFITWYIGVDPLVSPLIPSYSYPALINRIS